MGTIQIKTIDHVVIQLSFKHKQYEVVCNNADRRHQLQNVLAQWWQDGVPGLVGNHGVKEKTIEISRKNIFPDDPVFATIVLTRLRQLPWVAAVTIQRDQEQLQRIEAIREEITPLLSDAALRPAILTILSCLDRMTPEQLKQVQVDLAHR